MKLPINYSKSHWTVRKQAREEYIKKQDNKCYFCKEPLSGEPSKKIQGMEITERLFPENFFKWPVHLHHNHFTDKTIGAVHCKCNAVLFEYHGE